MAEAAPRPTAESARFPAEDRAATSPQVTAVRACAKDWRNAPLAERINLVRRLAATLNVEAESLAALIAAEVGKPIRFGRSELQHCLDMLDAIARRAKHADETIATNPAWFARRRPHGVVAAITPWNNPLYIPLGKIVPAVVFGNGVVWKPAPEARETSRSLLHCLGKAGWPEGLIGLVEGGPREGEALMREPGVGAVTITGSLAAGRAAQEICAEQHIPLQAELGGNNAAIVWPDVDLAAAARAVAAGAFEMAGQRCTANRRVIVHDDCREAFIPLLLEASAALQWGDPAEADTVIGPMVSTAHRDRVAALVQRAASYCDAPLLPLGSEPRSVGTHGAKFYPPTILFCDEPEATIVQEESFGPVLVVQKAQDWKEAISLCNGVRQGLVAAVFTTSDEIASRFLDEAEAGMLKVNQATSNAIVDAPFGGWKASGLGPPEHGQFDVEFFTRPQTVYGAIPRGTPALVQSESMMQAGASAGQGNIVKTLIALAARWPGSAAIVSSRLSLTYGELIARAARSARELRHRGVEPGSHVGITLRDGGEAVVAMVALWMLGTVPVPIDFRSKPDEQAQLASEFQLSTIIGDRQTSQASFASILVDDSWTDVIAKRDAEPFFEDSQGAPAIISLTSGTTGRPLGIVLGHEELLFRLESNIKLGRRHPHGKLISVIPISFSGSRNHILSQLLDGATIYFYPPLFSAGALIEAVRSRGATSLAVVPTILRALLEAPSRDGTYLFPGLDSLYCFGAPILPDEKRRARATLSRHFVEGYSSSLAGRMTVLYGADIDARPETVGRVLPHVTLEIVDEDDRPLPAGEVGAIRVRSPAVARAIYGTARDAGDQIKNGWAYPGDTGAVDGDGFLQLMGRSSDMIIRGGVNVHPSEVEAVLAELDGVKDVAVVGFAKSREGEEIAAFVVSSPELTEAALNAHCRGRLVSHKRPRKFVFVSDLPRNANGKILRTELRKRLEEAD
jgi:acyl-CoA reductase-like NAD-dependent aldehyde dehydrogenase/acyl-CoA synthetase (AMP-forming)/AMP-acid ligase II